jgi:hypothetical protein
MKKVLLLIFLLCLILVGCVPSLNPLYTDKDLILLPGLEGTWMDQDKNLWEFNRNGDKSYILTLTMDTANPQTFDANLVNLNNHIFMDLYPNNLVGASDMTKWHLMPMHSFSKVQLLNNNLSINMLNPGWIQDLVKQGKLYINYQVSSNGDGMLTASPADIQSFLRTYADYPEAFDGPKWQLTRYVKESTQTTSTTSQDTSSLSLDTSSTINLSSTTTSPNLGNGENNAYSILYLSPLSNRVISGKPFQLNVILDNPLGNKVDNLGLWIRYNPKALLLKQDPPFDWDTTLFSGWSKVTSFNDQAKGELYIQFKTQGEGQSLSGTLGKLEFETTGKIHDSKIQFRFNKWGSYPNTFLTHKNKDVLGKELDHADGTIGATVHILEDTPDQD